MPEVYRVGLPNIMHEMIENEVVVVNLDNGSYYSFDGVGGQIWELLEANQLSLEELTARIIARYSGTPEQIVSATAAFIKQLCDENLINVETGVEVNNADDPNDHPAKSAFVVPQLQKYTDMEALLLADPIHDVEDEGWPKLK